MLAGAGGLSSGGRWGTQLGPNISVNLFYTEQISKGKV